MSTVPERLATLERIAIESGQFRETVIGLLTQGNEQNIRILTKQAVMDGKLDDFTEYQKKCDSERDTMSDDIKDLKTSRRSLKAMVVAVSGFLGFTIPIGVEWFKK